MTSHAIQISRKFIKVREFTKAREFSHICHFFTLMKRKRDSLRETIEDAIETTFNHSLPLVALDDKFPIFPPISHIQSIDSVYYSHQSESESRMKKVFVNGVGLTIKRLGDRNCIGLNARCHLQLDHPEDHLIFQEFARRTLYFLNLDHNEHRFFYWDRFFNNDRHILQYSKKTNKFHCSQLHSWFEIPLATCEIVDGLTQCGWSDNCLHVLFEFIGGND